VIIVANCFLYVGLQGGSYLFILTCILMLKILLAMCCPSSDLKHLGFIHHLILRDETDGHPSNYDFSQLNFQGIIYHMTTTTNTYKLLEDVECTASCDDEPKCSSHLQSCDGTNQTIFPSSSTSCSTNLVSGMYPTSCTHLSHLSAPYKFPLFEEILC
jgi:hypothetical protein